MHSSQQRICTANRCMSGTFRIACVIAGEVDFSWLVTDLSEPDQGSNYHFCLRPKNGHRAIKVLCPVRLKAVRKGKTRTQRRDIRGDSTILNPSQDIISTLTYS